MNAMPENADKHEQAFPYIVRLLEKAVTAGATAVELKREEQDLMVVHCFKSTGQAVAPIPPDMEETVIEEIVKRAGLADNSRGVISVVLLGKDYHVVVDLNHNWGESEFTLTLKKGKQTATTPSSHGGVEPLNMEQPTAIITTPLSVDSQVAPMVEEAPPPTRQNTGRNDSCPCGSGKKFKKCCLNKGRQGGLFD